MGFVFLFASILTFLFFLSSICNDSSYKKKSRKQSIKNGYLTYGDGKGGEYLIDSGKAVYTHNGKIYDKKTYRVIKDYKKEREDFQRLDKINVAKQNNEKYVELQFPEYENKRYYIELSTMKRYYLSICKTNEYENGYVFRKVYYDNNPIEISKEEFISLGGYILENHTCYQIGKR